jgi:hypothetical protein
MQGLTGGPDGEPERRKRACAQRNIGRVFVGVAENRLAWVLEMRCRQDSGRI